MQTKGESDILVGCDVYIEMKGKDGQTHAITTQASSLFDGAAQAIARWSKLWWFDPETVLTVRFGDETWMVRQDAVRRWRGKGTGS